jgi:hypothetical protein
MAKIVDYTPYFGMQYGQLTIIAVSTEKHSDRTTLLECLCDCGNKVNALLRYLKSSKTRSCGCFRKSFIGHRNKGRIPSNAHPDPTHSSFVTLWCRYKTSARYKSIAFDLTQEEFRFLTKSDCHYCGQAPMQSIITRRIASEPVRTRKPYIYNGIDRANNNQGYTLENSLPCCSECNYLKSASDKSVFLNHITKIVMHQRKSS